MRLPFLLLAAAGLLAAFFAAPAAAQDPLFLVNDRTQVRSIGFSFADGQTFDEDLLQEQIAMTDMGGAVWIRKKLSFIPFVPEIGVHPFSPVEMQKDVVRLRRFYNRNGFLQPEVDWLVRLDTVPNTVKVVFTIDEGPPLLLDGLGFVGPDGGPAIDQFPTSLRPDWADFRDRIALQKGRRLDDFQLLQLENRTLGWVRDQGYAFANVNATSEVDSLGNSADVTIRVGAGPRARIDEIEVEGNESVSRTVVLRELPFRRGDRFSYSKLVDGQREVFGLNLFQIALADVPEDQPEDSTVTVRLRVREGDPRIVTGTLGYLSEAGFRTQAQWTHRNFFGAARTFTASAIANTGLGSFASQPAIVYRGSVSLRQPYFLNRRLALLGSPFAEYRDDERDRSTSFGGNTTLVYELEPLKTASVQYGIEIRDIAEYGAASTANLDLFSLLSSDPAALRDSLAGRVDRSTLALSATYGSLDSNLDPSLGYVFRPTAEVALPIPITTIEYSRLGASLAAFYPVTDGIRLFGRVTGGQLFPFGKSIPSGSPESILLEFVRLRNVVFTGGGTTDVRGWGNGLLGPKTLDIEISVDENQDTMRTAPRYASIGGFSKVSGTAEVRLPFPGFSESFGTFVFLDGGRVTTSDDRFIVETGDDPRFEGLDVEDDRFFFAAGGGVEFATPVGAIRFSVGYKLNPNYFDLRDPQKILEALQNGTPLAEVPKPSFLGIPEARRLHLHFGIGQTF